MKKKRLQVKRLEGPVVYKLPDEIARQLGFVVSRWAQIEALTNVIIYNLSGLGDVIGRLIVGTGHIEKQLEKIEDLLFVKGITIAPPLTSLKKDLLALRLERDEVAHGSWLLREGVLCVLETRNKWQLGEFAPKPSKRMFPAAKPITSADLEAIVVRMDDAITSLRSVNDQVIALLAPSREKPPKSSAPDHPDPDQKTPQSRP